VVTLREVVSEPREVVSEPREVVNVPREVVNVPREVVNVPRDVVAVPRAVVRASRELVIVPRGPVTAPRGPVTALRGPVTALRGPVTAPRLVETFDLLVLFAVVVDLAFGAALGVSFLVMILASSLGCWANLPASSEAGGPGFTRSLLHRACQWIRSHEPTS
jgi:hypothetical protein